MSGGRRHEMRWKTRGSGQVKENEIGPGGGGEGAQKERMLAQNTHKYVWIHMHLHLSRYSEDKNKLANCSQTQNRATIPKWR